MVKATDTTETSVNFSQDARRNNPEDSHLRVYTCCSPYIEVLRELADVCTLNATNFRKGLSPEACKKQIVDER
jgi:hypothetical protein